MIFKHKNVDLELKGFVKYNENTCSFVIVSENNVYKLNYVNIIRVENNN